LQRPPSQTIIWLFSIMKSIFKAPDTFISRHLF